MFKPVVADYPIRVVELARARRRPNRAAPGRSQAHRPVLTPLPRSAKVAIPRGKSQIRRRRVCLLGAITGDAIFERLLEEHKDTEDGEMTNSFERVRNYYRAEGFDLGEKHGEERGKQERSIEIARNLLSMRMAKPEVAKAMGLSIEEVDRLALSYV